MAERFVIVHRSYDPILIDHIGEMLREAGIAAKVLGTRDAALIGVGSSITELNISVPRSQASDATDFLEAFFADEGEELLQKAGLLDDGDEDEDGEDDDRPPPLLPMFAGLALLFCGLGHIYARRRITGIAFVAALVAAFAMMFSARSEQELLGLGLAMGALFVFDFIGAQVAVRAYNRGVRRGSLYQLVAAAIYLALVAGLSRVPSLSAELGSSLRPYPDLQTIERRLTNPPTVFESDFSTDPISLDPFEFR